MQATANSTAAIVPPPEGAFQDDAFQDDVFQVAAEPTQRDTPKAQPSKG